jgi:hypothetical protein
MRWKKAAKELAKGARVAASKLDSSKPQRAIDALVLEALELDVARLDELYAETARMGEVRRRLAAGRTKMRRERFTTDLAEVAKDLAVQLKPLLQGRRFPQDFLPIGAATSTLQLGAAPLEVHAELMMGHRHVLIESTGTPV